MRKRYFVDLNQLNTIITKSRNKDILHTQNQPPSQLTPTTMTQVSPSLLHQQSNSHSVNEDPQQLIEIMKRLLHQNNLSLYCSQNQTTQTLLDVISDNLSLRREQLHKIIVNKFRQMLTEDTLPKRLMYVYSDVEILVQYEKDPQLVSFYKITYELVCAIYEVKLIVYTLLERSDKNFLLNAMIVNPKGSELQLQLAKIGNKFYRVQEQFHQADQFSLPSLQSFPSAKSSNLNSQQKQEKEFTRMRQPFKSQQIIVDLESQQMNIKGRKLSPDYASISGDKVMKDNFSTVKKLRNQAKHQDKDGIKSQSMISEYGDQVSLGSMLDKEEQKELLIKCSNIGKEAIDPTVAITGGNNTPIHQNNHMPTGNIIHSPEMMYYYYHMPQHAGYTAQQAYPGKSEPYLPYAGHSISPNKNQAKLMQLNISNSPVKPMSTFSPIYPSQQPQIYPSQSQDVISIAQPQPIPSQQTATQSTLPPIEIKQGQRYKGRLKFFDQGKNYGFIIMDADDSDLFVHFDDLQKAGITKEKLKTYKQNQGYMQVKFTFKVMEYFGKYRQSRKAVELQVMEAP